MKPIVVGATLLLVAALWYLAHASSSRPRAPATAAATRVATARPLAQEDVRPLPPIEQAAAAPPPAVNAEAEEPKRHDVDTRRAFLEGAFSEQPVDPTWAGAARAEIASDLGRFVTPQARLGAVECRQALCRVELEVDHEGAANELLAAWLRNRRWNGPGSALPERTATGTRKVVLFIGRPGTPLPRP